MTGKLKRSVGLTGLIFYGVGTMVGGGIYALLGKVAGEAGIFTPWSMLVAGLMALFSALTFAELSARLPYSSGPAKYISEAFRSKKPGVIFGWLVIATGVVSAATLTVAMSGFFLDLIHLPTGLGKLIVACLLFTLASWGINQSVSTVAIITTIEVVGLLLVVIVNGDALMTANFEAKNYLPGLESTVWAGIIAGSFIAFYAFIGFEDMVTLAEEVKSSETTVPRAIIVSLLITLFLYILIALVAVLTSNLQEFTSSNTPMAHLVRNSNWLSPQVLVLISVLAGFNGALVQVIMASRVLFGMGQAAQAPALFAQVNKKTQTPVLASFLVAVVVFVLALLIDLTTLAKITSAIILIVFAGMNLSLLKIKRFRLDYHGFSVPYFVPVIGLILSLGSLLFALIETTGSVH